MLDQTQQQTVSLLLPDTEVEVCSHTDRTWHLASVSPVSEQCRLQSCGMRTFDFQEGDNISPDCWCQRYLSLLPHWPQNLTNVASRCMLPWFALWAVGIEDHEACVVASGVQQSCCPNTEGCCALQCVQRDKQSGDIETRQVQTGRL